MDFAQEKMMKISSIQPVNSSEGSNDDSNESLPKRKTADSFESYHSDPSNTVSELFWTEEKVSPSFQIKWLTVILL
jgi:hypothetical protein